MVVLFLVIFMKQLVSIIAVLVLVAACTSAPARSETPETVAVQTSVNTQQVTAQTPTSSVDVKTDLKSIFASNGEYKCTVSITGQQGGESVVYYKNGRVRTDVKTAQGEAHAIYGGDDLWTWSSTQAGEQCFKINTKQAAAGSPTMQSVNVQSKDDLAQNAANVKCEPTSIPESVFTPPTNCKDMNELLKGLQGMQGVPANLPTG